MPMMSSNSSRSLTAHAEWSITSKGCTTWEPSTFRWPVWMVLPPVLAHTSSPRYHAVRPSSVLWTGIRSTNAAGAREVHRSGGSVKWASQSMMSTSPRTLDVSCAVTRAVMRGSSFAPCHYTMRIIITFNSVLSPVDDLVQHAGESFFGPLDDLLHVGSHEALGRLRVTLLDGFDDCRVVVMKAVAVAGREQRRRDPLVEDVPDGAAHQIEHAVPRRTCHQSVEFGADPCVLLVGGAQALLHVGPQCGQGFGILPDRGQARHHRLQDQAGLDQFTEGGAVELKKKRCHPAEVPTGGSGDDRASARPRLDRDEAVHLENAQRLTQRCPADLEPREHDGLGRQGRTCLETTIDDVVHNGPSNDLRDLVGTAGESATMSVGRVAGRVRLSHESNPPDEPSTRRSP